MTRRGLFAMILAPFLRRRSCEVTIQHIGTSLWTVWHFNEDGKAVVTRCASCRDALDTAHRILISDLA